MIQLRDLRVTREGKTICQVEDLSLQAGEHLMVYGSNGSGKSTLLRVMAGLETDFEGQLKRSDAGQKPVYVHQATFLFRGTVLANVSYGLRAKGGLNREAKQRCLEQMERLGILHLEKRLARTLSGGEQRRVALARAFVLKPELLLIDEPMADLDAKAAELVSTQLSALQNTTLVIASPQSQNHPWGGRSMTMESMARP